MKALSTDRTTLVFRPGRGPAWRLAYWGPRLAAPEADLAALPPCRRPVPGGPDEVIEPTTWCLPADGWLGPPGLEAHPADGAASRISLVQCRVDAGDDPHALDLKYAGETLAGWQRFRLDPGTDVLTVQSGLANTGETPVWVDWCAAACLPIPCELTELMGFTGKWAGEFQIEPVAAFTGAYVRENRAGRTSHQSFPGLIAKAPWTRETDGPALAIHLGWSGNHRLRVDRTAEGDAVVQAGELLLPGEVRLGPGERYESPVLYAVRSGEGLNGLSRRLHAHVRERLEPGPRRRAARPRLVHYNTWEVVYFDLDEARLREIATKAAGLGVERFVLDDGWFGGRRSDKAGLGDWTVSPDVFPNGLGPLIDHVKALGMDFGLWVEPEMANLDSDLLRDHPDWTLGPAGPDAVPFRNQFALDLTRDEVWRHLFERLDAVLGEYDIAYLKWDMNRDLHDPIGGSGRPVAGVQPRAVYGLIDALRARHPTVEIESCASGGGRADYGILQRTDRIWTSDNNDALDRQAIQRGASYFFPLEVLGSHVGPRRCHITGRALSMEMRAVSAMFGHMGVEADLSKETPGDLETLARAIALYKTHRALLHSGDLVRLETPPHLSALAVVAADQSEALISCACVAS